MRTIFNNLSLPVKLMIIGVIPLIFLIYFAVQIAIEKNERIETLNYVLRDVDASIAVTNVGNQIFLERRLSLSNVLRNQNQTRLIVQREKTDEAVEALSKSHLGVSFENYKRLTFLNDLRAKRDEIDKREISDYQVLYYYSAVLTRLHNFTTPSVENKEDFQSIRNDLISQKLIAQLNDHLGYLRAEVYAAIVTGIDTEQQIYSIENSAKLLFSYWDEFAEKSTSSSNAELARIRQTAEARHVDETIKNIIETKQVTYSEDAEVWWSSSGKVVDDLNRVQGEIVDRVKTQVNAMYEREVTMRNWHILILLAIIAFTIFILIHAIRSISQALQELKNASEVLAIGKTGIELKINTNDALGSLASAIKAIDSNNRHLSEAAEEIGKGNFEIAVSPRSNEDVLGNAIVRMKEDLHNFTSENADKIWIQTGIGLLNKGIQGEKSLDELSAKALNVLVNYLEVETGLFYVSDEQKLVYYNGYAIEDATSVPRIVSFGETLIGQVAIDKEITTLENVPEEFLKIRTASGNTLPRYIHLVPLVNNDIIEGVIELGSINPIRKIAFDLLREISKSLAIALHVAKSRARLQLLLEETEAQSEELQTQHSELETLNNELETQTLKLQSSEEELKVQQEELLQANQELEERARLLEEKNHLIVERNLEVQKKAEELEISTRYKSEFLANMSHELRTPLNSILLLSRLIKENHEKNLTDEQVEYAEVIQSSGNGLLTLIDEILDLSKIESGKMDLEYSDTAIDEIVSELKSLFAPLAREKNLELKFDIDPTVPSSISTDKLRLGQILKNLISNALKFTSKGSIQLKISIPEENDSLISFSVVDTGIGIPASKQGLVFEAFKQADGSTRRKYGGTGLGLSISKELSKLLGGDINLKSEQGVGTEFTVVIPQSKVIREILKETMETEAESIPFIGTEEPVRPVIETKPRYTVPAIPQDIADDRTVLTPGEPVILIIEDDTMFAKALLSFTRNKGYKGIVAVRGDVGIELAIQYKPIAILLDIQLPVKDGWQVMEELKSNPETRHIPVHIMSAIDSKRESLMKGAVDFINKPVALEQMQAIFQRLENALSKGPRKVLILEENPKHAKALSYFLETFSIHSEVTENVPDGIKALKKEEVDCVILDMGVPDEASYKVLETVKQNPGLEEIPIIVFTGKNLSKVEEAKLKHYADSIVVKTAHSYQRILDEVALFLHLVEEKKTSTRKNGFANKLGNLTEVLKDKTVLIADDDVRNIFSLTKVLEQLKMKVVSATDGKEAIRILEENPDVEIVLMDMMMPEMDGFESTALIRQNPKYKNLPILAVTAKAMVGDRDRCIKAGASDYISKPVDMDQLISLLRVWLYDRGR